MKTEEPSVTLRKECRACDSTVLSLFLDLGKSPLANSFVKKEDLDKPEAFYPLRVFVCQDCWFVQLVDIVRPDILFRDYIYFSTGVPTVPEHFREYARSITEQFAKEKEDLIVEIGSNDGVLLSVVQEAGRRVLGVDPAVNVAKVANERGIPTIAEFFNTEIAKKIRKEHGAAKVIVGNNVIAHIDALQDALQGVSLLLADDGIFMFEAPYLRDMFDNLAFDTVYHEHASYLAVLPLKKLLGRFGMEIFDVKTFPVQGVSLRVYAGKKGVHPVQRSVEEFSEIERKMGLNTMASYEKLAEEIKALKERVLNLLHGLKKEGKRIAGYGAPAKGNTLLNYFGIGSDILDYATEELPSKIGLFTPGTHLPAVHIGESRKLPPDYYFMLAWNAKNAIVRNEQAFLEKGGKFIVPIGRVTEIISKK